MAEFQDLSEIVNRMTGGNFGSPETIFAFKSGRFAGGVGATVTGQFTSLWLYDGQRPTHGATPTSPTQPVNDTPGCVGQANPAASRNRWLLSFTATCTRAGTLFLGDRLAHCGGLSTTSTSAQTIGSSPDYLSSGRYLDGACVGNEIWVEFYETCGGTSNLTTITATYTNQDGDTGQVTQAVAIGGTGLREIGRFIRLPLASGDTGVRLVQTVTLGNTIGSGGTPGNFGVTIVRPVAFVPVPIVAASASRDLISRFPGPVNLVEDSALFFYFLANGTVAPDVHACLTMGDR